MAPALTESLSGNDSAVLSALFDPESSLSSTVKIDSSLPLLIDPLRLSVLQEQERSALQHFNCAKPGRTQIEYAVAKLTSIIEENPIYASALINRAQARRMLFADVSLAEYPDQVRDIADDLAKAISITTPKLPTESISPTDAKILASAHTHRGYLLLLASKSEYNRRMIEGIPALRALQREDLEELASRELGLGGRYGNDTARQLAVKTNPYAKLCGSIVKEALQKEISDHWQIQVNAP